MTAFKSKLFIFTLLALALMTMPLLFVVTSARPLDNVPIGPIANFASSLNLDEESSNCWESLFQLQSCSGEVIMFFVNGQTYLGHGCCEAIRTIEHRCWPALLGTLGYTTQETDVLEGYCDAADHIQPPPSTTPPPSANEATKKTVVPHDLEKLVP